MKDVFCYADNEQLIQEWDKEIEDYDFAFGVPCSKLPKEIVDNGFICNKENEALALAFGVLMGGRKPLVFVQNSGLCNIIDPITSLLRPCNVEIDLVVSIRHKPEHHSYIGEITKKLMNLIGYKNWAWVEEDE